MITIICFILFVAILVCCLCYFSRHKTPRKQCAFEAFVYIDLQMKTEMRVTNVTAETLDVQKNGIKPAGKGGNAIIEEQDDGAELEDISAPEGSPEPKRKSGRSRAPPGGAD